MNGSMKLSQKHIVLILRSSNCNESRILSEDFTKGRWGRTGIVLGDEVCDFNNSTNNISFLSF